MISRRGLVALAVLVAGLGAGCSGGTATSVADSTTDTPSAIATSAGPSRVPVAPTATARPARPRLGLRPSPRLSPSPTPAVGSKDYGYFTGVLSAKMPVRLSFDRALFLTGAEADKAAAAHGDESPVPNDYYVVNDSKKLRTLTLASTVKVLGSFGLNSYAGDKEKVEASPRTLKELLGFLGTEEGKQTGFHLAYGTAGVVVSVEEQYQP